MEVRKRVFVGQVEKLSLMDVGIDKRGCIPRRQCLSVLGTLRRMCSEKRKGEENDETPNVLTDAVGLL